VEQRGEIDLPKALDAFRSFDWDGDLMAQAAKMEAGEDFCPFGLGFDDAEGNILHVYAVAQDSFEIIHHRRIRRKLLGFIPLRYTAMERKEDLSPDDAMRSIERFFQNDRTQPSRKEQHGV
jgi:hypothetical protein